MFTFVAMDLSSRRIPKQTRSRAIVDAIFEAVSRLLRDDAVQLTTHDVAHVAGVSVGSLYRYFPSKDSLLHAWLAKLVDQRTARVRALLENSRDLELRDVFTQLVDVAAGARREQGIYEGVLVRLFLRFGAVDILQAQDTALVPSLTRMLRDHEHETRALEPELCAFVLLYALRAVLVAAAHQPGLLDHPDVREELVRLAVSYVARAPLATPTAPRQ